MLSKPANEQARREATNFEKGEARRLLIWRLFSRDNPVLPPRRKAATALTWAEVIKHVCLWLSECGGADWDDLTAWAARTVLDCGTEIEMPPGYTALGCGTLRRQAHDGGGVEGHVLMTLADIMVDRKAGRLRPMNAHTWAAWRILYPDTAEPELADPAEIVAEWDLVFAGYRLSDNVTVTWSDGDPDFSAFGDPRRAVLWGRDCNNTLTKVHVALSRDFHEGVGMIVAVHVQEDGFTAEEMTDCILAALGADDVPIYTNWGNPREALMAAIDRTVRG